MTRLICIECTEIFEDRTVEEKQKDGTTASILRLASDQAYRHNEGHPNEKTQPQKHNIMPCDDAAFTYWTRPEKQAERSARGCPSVRATERVRKS